MLPHTILALRSDTHSLGRSAKPSSERSVGPKENHRERGDIVVASFHPASLCECQRGMRMPTWNGGCRVGRNGLRLAGRSKYQRAARRPLSTRGEAGPRHHVPLPSGSRT
jgi:hypothetical protein